MVPVLPGIGNYDTFWGGRPANRAEGLIPFGGRDDHKTENSQPKSGKDRRAPENGGHLSVCIAITKGEDNADIFRIWLDYVVKHIKKRTL
jgi:hypothetical protein